MEPPPAYSFSADESARCRGILSSLTQTGLFNDPERPWRISPKPFPVSSETLMFLERLGDVLLSFYRALNDLYADSARGAAPAWVAEYLDIGKPDGVVAYGRMNRLRQAVPGVIRPDLILTQDGMVATELDAVPGGIGLTAALSLMYAAQGVYPTHLANEMVIRFAEMIRSLSPTDPVLAVVVSDESADYRPEMRWLGEALKVLGLKTFVVAPQEMTFTEAGLFVEGYRVDVIYRFFELFDLPNIPKSELILYAVKKKQVVMTPPPKAFFEEKSAFALFHHPALASHWKQQLGEASFSVLKGLFPKTWIMDARPLPPHAVIPGLLLNGEPVSDFHQLGKADQKGRAFVIKPSGFSERAWGSRGVVMGHDLSEPMWQDAIDTAIKRFNIAPEILQQFHKGRKVEVAYYDFERAGMTRMEGRVRLCPYYFVVDRKTTRLGGTLATICPSDKKRIHGMSDAVMVPCAVER